KPIERIEVQKLDSSPQATNRNNEKATHGGNIDNITQLQKQYKGKKGHKSAKFGEKKGHKKGHKTRGYNNRFHKDEYVKEHKLYGDGYRNNQRNQYKNAHDASAKKRTSYEKSNKRNHGYSEDKFGKKGVDDVGKFDKRHKDFERDSNHQQYNNHHTKNIELKEATNPYPNHRPY
ncbi:component of gems protein 1-like, partial [Diorhabda carinulata]|uniref:component of gems protein 1-like n=1 Tax=Diorhabda carinulata TaxID=1163345 RepID=UPI0025A0754D